MRKAIVPRLRRGRQRPADRSDQPLLLRGPAAARLRSRQGQVPPPEGEARQRAGAGRRVAGGRRLGRNGDAAAAGRAAGGPEPGCQAHAGRRLLVESLDEASARLRQHQPAPERRRAASRSSSSPTRRGTKRAGRTRSSTSCWWPRAARPDEAKRKQMYADMQVLVHEKRRHRHPAVPQLARRPHDAS